VAVAFASLADGQLAAAEADIYTVPASTSLAAGEVRLFNTNTTAETVRIFVQRSGGTSRQLFQAELVANGHAQWPIPELATGDKVRAYTTTAVKVNYIVHGRTVT